MKEKEKKWRLILIANEELKSMIKRLELIVNNCDNAQEKYGALIVIQNLSNMTKQLDSLEDSSEFKAQAEQWSKENGIEK